MSISENIRNIKNNIPKDVTLVAVTKTRSIEEIKTAYDSGHKIFGENKVQELVEKHDKLTKDIDWHMIGHLQRNKARKAVQLFDVIQTIDSLKLAIRINKISNQEKKKQKIFLQVNTGCDSNKHGFSKKESITAAKEIADMKGLSLLGIMTIPPNNISRENLKSIYKDTRKIRDIVQKSIEKRCKSLSMGMSNDYEIAIEEGATHIRLGTVLFGNRPK